MKKTIILSMLIALTFTNCKNESKPAETLDAVPEKVKEDPVTSTIAVVNPQAVMPADFDKTHSTYDGLGMINNNADINYNVLMPLLKSGSYEFVQFYNIGDNVLFMQMQDDDFEPTSENVYYNVKQNVANLNFNLKEKISVFLYFENGKILSEKEAIKVYVRGCSGMNEPKKCGTGVLSYTEW